MKKIKNWMLCVLHGFMYLLAFCVVGLISFVTERFEARGKDHHVGNS